MISPKIQNRETGCKPVCAFCDSDEVRMYSGAYGRPGEPWYVEPSYACEDCFMPDDCGPCFDDLPQPPEAE